jgi:hypothetical protein
MFCSFSKAINFIHFTTNLMQKMSTLLRCGDRSYFNITLQRADNGHRVDEYLF